MERGKVIDNANIKAGNVIVGLASYGQATYETSYNGGMGSNGLTSARHDVFAKALALSFPESFEFETMNKQKQPEKKQFPTSSSLVVFYTNDFFDLIDKSTS